MDVAGGAIAIQAWPWPGRAVCGTGGRPAETACERPHKAFPRKRRGVARKPTIEVGVPVRGE
jgi:hypothetical protein